MTAASWKVSGQYYETCNCAFMCPCILQQMQPEPTEGATAEQSDAITAIASGAAGGPMAGLSGLIGKFLGVESAPIEFGRNGPNWSVTAAKLVDIAGQPAMGINPEATEPMYVENSGHPAAHRLALSRPLKMHVDALGLSWNDTSGKNSGLYAPFSWGSA